MKQAKVMMDDMLILGFGSFDKNLRDVDKVITRLRKKGIQTNPEK